MSSINSYLGTGEQTETSFQANGKPAIVSGIDNIGQQIKRVILNPVADNFYSRNQGSELYKMQFMPNDPVTRSLMSTFIQEAIKGQVPLVLKSSVSFEPTSDVQTILISISFTVKSSQAVGSVTFPFDFK